MAEHHHSASEAVGSLTGQIREELERLGLPGSSEFHVEEHVAGTHVANILGLARYLERLFAVWTTTNMIIPPSSSGALQWDRPVADDVRISNYDYFVLSGKGTKDHPYRVVARSLDITVSAANSQHGQFARFRIRPRPNDTATAARRATYKLAGPTLIPRDRSTQNGVGSLTRIRTEFAKGSYSISGVPYQLDSACAVPVNASILPPQFLASGVRGPALFWMLLRHPRVALVQDIGTIVESKTHPLDPVPNGRLRFDSTPATTAKWRFEIRPRIGAHVFFQIVFWIDHQYHHGRTPPPPPAPLWTPTSARAPRPPPAATHKGPLRPGTSAPLASHLGDARPPPAAPLRRPAEQDPAVLARDARAAIERQEDLERAVTLDLFLLRTLAQLTERRASASPTDSPLSVDLGTLFEQHREREGTVVEDALAYEPTPGPARRIRLDGRAEAQEAVATGVAEQDGVVVVAHVLGGAETRVSICSGFAAGRAKGDDGQLILTCAHTLESMRRHVRATTHATPSATFVLASSGHVYTVTSLASSSSESDLLLLRLSHSPINPSSIPVLPLRSLPINPYPPPTSSAIAVHTYLNPLARLRRKLHRLPEREWGRGRVAEYKDPIGRTAEVGTYDSLASMWMDCCPTPGSSGGPVVDCESGSVVGVTRGSTHQHGERQRYGFATPAERIFELFRLPGFKSTAEREAEKDAARDKAERGAPQRAGGQEGEAK